MKPAAASAGAVPDPGTFAAMRAHRRFFVHLLLAVALLGAQSLAWVHGVLHVQHPHRHAEPNALAPANAATSAHGARGIPATWLSGLWSEHHGGADCLLFDHLAGGDQAPAFALATLDAAAPAGLPAPCASGVWAATAWLPFHARAPPAPG